MKTLQCVSGRIACGVSAFVVASLAVLIQIAPAHAVTIDWVTVGDPGNTGQTNNYINGGTLTFGAVNDTFQIMKFEWTNSQYVDFLNAVDPNGTNPNAIYNTSMGSDARGGISFDANASAGGKNLGFTNGRYLKFGSGNEDNQAGFTHQLRDFGYAADVLGAILGGEPEIRIQAVPEVVAIESVDQAAAFDEAPLERCGDGALAAAGDAGLGHAGQCRGDPDLGCRCLDGRGRWG